MFMIEWIFDKMGYTKKVDWTAVFANMDHVQIDPVPRKKPAKKVKLGEVPKKTVRKTVRAKKD